MLYIRDGYVYYQRLNTIDQPVNWYKYADTAEEQFNAIPPLDTTVKYSDLAARLRSMGHAEQKNELEIFSRIFGTNINNISPKEYQKVIKIINQLSELANKYPQIKLNYLQELQKQASVDESLTNEINSALYNEIIDQIRNFIRTATSTTLIMNGDYGAWEDEMERRINIGVQRGLKKIDLSKINSNLDRKAISQILDGINFIQESQQILGQYETAIFKRFNLKAAVRALREWQQGRIQSQVNVRKTTKGLAPELRQFMSPGKLGTRNLAQALSSYVADSLGGTFNINTCNFSSDSGDSLESEIELFDYQLEVNLSQLTDSLGSNAFNNFQGDRVTDSVIRSIKEFYNFLDGLDDGFVVYESFESLMSGNPLDKFGGGVSGQLSDLPAFMNKIGASVTPQQVVYRLYNTIPGAIFAGEQESITQEIKENISANIANYLFSNWNVRNLGGDGKIHMFNMGGSYMPLSQVLIGMATAIERIEQSSSNFVDLRVNLPGSILYPEKLPGNLPNLQAVYAYWDRQRAAAEESSSFSVKFQLNFNSFIMSYFS